MHLRYEQSWSSAKHPQKIVKKNNSKLLLLPPPNTYNLRCLTSSLPFQLLTRTQYTTLIIMNTTPVIHDIHV